MFKTGHITGRGTRKRQSYISYLSIMRPPCSCHFPPLLSIPLPHPYVMICRGSSKPVPGQVVCSGEHEVLRCVVQVLPAGHVKEMRFWNNTWTSTLSLIP